MPLFENWPALNSVQVRPPSAEPRRVSPKPRACESVALTFPWAIVLVTKSVAETPVSCANARFVRRKVGAAVSSVYACSFTNVELPARSSIRSFKVCAAPRAPACSAAPGMLSAVPLNCELTSRQVPPPSRERLSNSPAAKTRSKLAVMVCVAVLVIKSLALAPVSALKRKDDALAAPGGNVSMVSRPAPPPRPKLAVPPSLPAESV